MNAYEILGLKGLENEKGKKNILITTRVKTGLARIINELNEELKRTTGEEKLKLVDKKLDDMLQYVFAYAFIGTEEERKEYKGEDVEEATRRFRKNTSKQLTLDKAGIEVDAFRVLGLTNRVIGKGELRDEEIKRKASQMLNISLTAPLNNLSDVDKAIERLLDITWAYNKIGARDDRIAYSYKTMGRKSRRIVNSDIKPKLKSSDAYTTIYDLEPSQGYDSVEIGATNARVVREGLTPNDDINVFQYSINKQLKNLRFEHTVYSGIIDTDRLRNKEYMENIFTLMGDKNLALARRFAGGYIGEERDNYLVFSINRMGACILYGDEARVDLGPDERYNNVGVRPTNFRIIQEGMTPNNSATVSEYIVTKQMRGRKIEHVVYSNIDMDKLRIDEIYRGEVLSLLSDEKLDLARESSGGYVGEVENGYSEIARSMCLSYRDIMRAAEERRETKERRRISAPQDTDDGLNI